MNEDHPTNSDLQLSIQKQGDTMRAHTAEDHEQFEAIHARFDELDKKQDAMLKKLDPVVGVYQATILNAKFITGLGGVVFALGTIGGGIFWLVQNLFKH